MSLLSHWRRASRLAHASMSVWALALAAAGAPALAAVGLPVNVAALRADRPISVTLITGDRVQIDSQGRLLGVRPGPGRQSITFQTIKQGTELIVTPADAAPLIRQGVVDPRLFNVSMLVRYGYDDARRDTVPTISRGIGGAATPTANRPRLAELGLQSPRELGAVRALAGGVQKRRAHEFWNEVKRSGVAVTRDASLGPRLWLDGKRDMLLDQSVQQIGAPVAWAMGLTGSGVKLAVLDSGVDAKHPDFAGRIVASANFTGESDTDVVGHGTHVASTAVGSGAASGGRYRGVAPEASLLVGKVCEQWGCQESAMLAGMQWAAETQRARVINMSIGATGTPDIDVLEEAVDSLSASTGALFVISAGNSGCGAASTIASPSTAQAALSVGAVDRLDKIASFSSCGPRQGDFGVKPEITAPGVDIVAARSSTSSFPSQGPGGAYTALSGTSMASPHVAGVAAILAQQHPGWTGAMIKAALIGSAQPAAGASTFVQGAGRVTVPAALEQIALANEPNTAFGVQLWPHADDPLLSRTLTFNNSSKQPQVLTLAVQASGSGGAAAPPGMFYLSNSQINVPAGGSASVILYANTGVNVADTAYAGQVVASAGAASTKSLFSVYKEPESYDLTLRHLDRAGMPTTSYTTQLIGLDTQSSLYLSEVPARQVVLRLPKGRYMMMSGFSDATGSDTLFAPELNVDRTMQLTIDARSTKPWRTTVPEKGAGILFRQLAAARWNQPVGAASFSLLSFDLTAELRFGPIGSTRATTDFAFSPMAYMGHAVDEYGTPDGRYPLTLALDRLAYVPLGWERAYRADEFAQITTYLPPAAVVAGSQSMVAETPGGDSFMVLTLVPVGDKPLVTRVTRAPTIGWSHEIFFQPPNGSPFSDSALLVRAATQNYEPGRDYVIDRRAPGPFSPTVNTSWSAYVRGALPGQYYGDPASKLPPMLRRQSSTAGTDLMLINLSEYGAADGSSGLLFTPPDLPKRLSISRNGVVEASADLVLSSATTLPVASVDGDYTLREEVPNTGALGKALGLPTSSVTEWNFRSAKGSSQQWDVLPISVIRVGVPAVVRDAGGRNLRQWMRFPIQVLRQAAPQPVPDNVSQLSVMVSSDGGVNWKAALVTGGSNGQWFVTTLRPSPGKSLSLKTSAVSADGASVQQTLIDAFPALAMVPVP